MTAVATIPRPEVFRQSLLASFEKCPRRTKYALMTGDDLSVGWVEASGDLGTAFHSFAAEYLKTLYRQGESQMATQEAVEIMRETYQQGDIVLPAEERDALVGMVLGFCEHVWQPSRFMALERRLTLDVACRDGEVRTLKGTPDLIIADPPHGLIIADWKSGRGVPKKPRAVKDGDDGEVEGKQYLSDRGHFQLDTYGLLAMRGTLDDGSLLAPGVKYVTLKEFHLRSGKTRLARLAREELEHVEWQIQDHLMKLDRGIGEGPGSGLWRPRPGSHCAKQCPVGRSCPIPVEMRGEGAIDSVELADEVAGIYARSKAGYTQAADQLKAWEEAGNRPGRANEREEVRWDPPGAFAVRGGGRKFGLHPRVDTTISEGEA